MAYLIDTDIFIAAKNLHYGMDFCPAFWDWLIQVNQAGRLLSIEAVKDDLANGGDDLADWAQARGDGFFLSPTEGDLAALGQVTQWISYHRTYVGAAEPSGGDGEPFGEKMKRLTSELYEQMAKAQEMDAAIRQNLEELGYGS